MRYRPIRFHDVGSTNDIARDAARAGASAGLVVQADRQATGKGRSARDWASPAGGLWMSVVLDACLPEAATGLVPLGVGVACCAGLADVGADVSLRWPNDLMLGDKKVGGILVEARTEDGVIGPVVAGIGINVQNEPPVPQAATLKDAKASVTVPGVRDAILARLARVEDTLGEGDVDQVCAWFMRYAWGLDRVLLLDGNERIPIEIAVDGALIVEDLDGNVEVHRSGSLRRPSPEKAE